MHFYRIIYRFYGFHLNYHNLWAQHFPLFTLSIPFARILILNRELVIIKNCIIRNKWLCLWKKTCTPPCNIIANFIERKESVCVSFILSYNYFNFGFSSGCVGGGGNDSSKKNVIIIKFKHFQNPLVKITAETSKTYTKNIHRVVRPPSKPTNCTDCCFQNINNMASLKTHTANPVSTVLLLLFLLWLSTGFEPLWYFLVFIRWLRQCYCMQFLFFFFGCIKSPLGKLHFHFETSCFPPAHSFSMFLLMKLFETVIAHKVITNKIEMVYNIYRLIYMLMCYFVCQIDNEPNERNERDRTVSWWKQTI